MRLSASHLGFSLDDRELLQGITLDVTPGTITGIIGPNGAGKSTLLSLLAGIREAGSGSITLDGISLGEWNPRALARVRAWLPQQAPVHWPRSVKQVVLMGRMPFPDSGTDADIVTRCLQVCGMEALQDRLFSTLSAGEQALAHLARILAGNPRLMLLDEPVAALDPGHVLRVMGILDTMKRTASTSSVVVLHDLAVAARWCDHLVLLHRGRLVAQGVPEVVLSTDNLRACYGVETRLQPGQCGLIPEYLERQETDA